MHGKFEQLHAGIIKELPQMPVTRAGVIVARLRRMAVSFELFEHHTATRSWNDRKTVPARTLRRTTPESSAQRLLEQQTGQRPERAGRRCRSS